MSNNFFGELLRQYEILEAELPQQNKMNERRQSLQQGAQPPAAAPAQQPGFLGRMGNYAGGEAKRAGNYVGGGVKSAGNFVGRQVDSAVKATAELPGRGKYNPFNAASQWVGDRIGQFGKGTPELDGRIAQQNQINQNKYRASDQYKQDTTDIYKRDQQKAVQKYDELIKQNNAKLNAPTAPTPAQAPAPVARPQVPMAAASVAPQAPVQAPAPVPAPRPQVNAAAQEVERLRAAARAKRAAEAAQPRR